MTDNLTNPRRRTVAAGLGTLLAAPGLAVAQAPRWKPERPITIYNPFAVGGITDLHMRLVGEKVGKVLGQQILVEARAGLVSALTVLSISFLSYSAVAGVVGGGGIGDLAIRYGYTPIWTALLEDPDLEQALPLLPVLRRGLEHAELRPLTPLYAQLSDSLQRQLSALITGEQPAAEAMTEAQRQSELILQAAGERP